MIYDISCKTLIGPKTLHIRFYKIDELLMMLITVELDIFWV